MAREKTKSSVQKISKRHNNLTLYKENNCSFTKQTAATFLPTRPRNNHYMRKTVITCIIKILMYSQEKWPLVTGDFVNDTKSEK